MSKKDNKSTYTDTGRHIVVACLCALALLLGTGCRNLRITRPTQPTRDARPPISSTEATTPRQQVTQTEPDGAITIVPTANGYDNLSLDTGERRHHRGPRGLRAGL